MTGNVEGTGADDDDDDRRPSTSFDQLVPARIHRVSDMLEDLARLMLGEAYGLGFTEARILAYLQETRIASVVDLSRDLRIDKAWISRRLHSLETRKLIMKRRDESDSRMIQVSLTEKGALAAGRTMGVVRETYSSIMNGVDEATASSIIGTLEANLITIRAKLNAG